MATSPLRHTTVCVSATALVIFLVLVAVSLPGSDTPGQPLPNDVVVTRAATATPAVIANRPPADQLSKVPEASAPLVPALAPSSTENTSSAALPTLSDQLAAVERSLPLLKVQNFHFQRQVPRATASDLRPHHRAFVAPSTNESLQISCPSTIRPDHFCVPNLGREWDARRGDRVFPVSYTLPLDDYVEEPPQEKTKDCSIIVPRDKSTYKFTSHAAYIAEYASSFYCLTFKKGGWDTLRHYEVIAAGCMPFMIDVEYIPAATMAHYPKQLVLEARRLPGVHFDCKRIRVVIDHAVFPRARYFELLAKVIAHAREHMTTVASARYALEVVGLNADSDPPPRVLVVTKVQKGAPLRAQGNYNSWSLFHGLRTLLGANAVDSHIQSFLYEQPLEVMKKQRPNLYGRGFGYAYKLKPLPEAAVNRSMLGDQLRERRFDAVFFTDPFSASILKRKNAFWFYDDARSGLPKERIAFLHAPDIPYPNPGVAGYDVTRLYAMGTVLQREIPDCQYYAPPRDDAGGREAEAMKRCVWYHNANCFDDVNIAATIERVPALKARGDYIWAWPHRGEGRFA